MVRLEGLLERSDYATWGVQWAGSLLATSSKMNLLATPVMIIATYLKPDNNRALISWFPCEVLFFWTILGLTLYNLRRRRFDSVRLLCLSYMLIEYTAIFLLWSCLGRAPAIYARLIYSFDWALLPLANGLQLAVVKLCPLPNTLLVLFSMSVRTCFHMRVFKSSVAVALFKAALANGLAQLLASTMERYKRAAYERHLKQSKDGSSSTVQADVGALPLLPKLSSLLKQVPRLSSLKQMVRLDAFMEHSELATWGVKWAGPLLRTWSLLILVASPVMVIITVLKPDNSRALVSWFPCETLYFWIIPALILHSQRRQRFDLVRLFFLSFTFLAGLGDLIWSCTGQAPAMYARVEGDFDWALLPFTFGLQLAVVKLRPLPNTLLMLSAMAVRIIFHMRAFKSSAAVALFKAALAVGLSVVFARAIKRAMLRSFEQEQRRQDKKGRSGYEMGPSSLHAEPSIKKQWPPAQQQQQQLLQLQQQQLPFSDKSEHVQSSETASQLVQGARTPSKVDNAYKRLTRTQVNVVIHDDKMMPEEVSSKVFQDLSQEISLRLPGSMVFNAAVRKGCVIVSFTLRCPEVPQGVQEDLPGTSTGMGSVPSGSSQHAMGHSAQQQQQPEMNQRHVEAIRATVLQWLVASGLSAKLRQDACVNIQVDDHVAECKWLSQKAAWVAGCILPLKCQSHGSVPPCQNSKTAAAKPQISLPSPVAVISTGPTQQQQQQQEQQQSKIQHSLTSTPVRLTASLHNLGTRSLIGWRSVDAQVVPLHAHDDSTADPAADSHDSTAPPFTLLARVSNCFLSVDVSESAQDPANAIGDADQRQVEVIVHLHPDLASTTTPLAIELELWESDACLANHPALLMPASLSRAAQELALDWAVVRDTLKQQQQLLEQLQPQQQEQHRVLRERQADLWESQLTYMQDLCDFLQLWRAEQEGVHQSSEQIAIMDAMGADLLHHTRVSGMRELANLLSSRQSANNASADQAQPAPVSQQSLTSPHSSTTIALSSPCSSTANTTAMDVWPAVEQAKLLTLLQKALHTPATETAASMPPTPQMEATFAEAISLASKELCPCRSQSEQPPTASSQFSDGSSVTGSSVTNSSICSRNCEDSRRSSVLCGKRSEPEELEEKEAQVMASSSSHWSRLVKALASLHAWLLGQVMSVWSKLSGIFMCESPKQGGNTCIDKKNT